MSAIHERSAGEIATDVASGRHSALAVCQASLAAIEADNPALGAFTQVTTQRALARAGQIDEALARGQAVGPLAGVPFAVKNLFDIAGLPTLAGSKINTKSSPASRDATLITRLEAAGAVLVGALNMGEYAYDFTGENAHYGPSRNPHAPDRMSGGSSGGSGTAVASGMVPLALGSDTNGSIRVPASLCGLFGLKPTYGRLSRAGTFPFVASLDHVGPLARSVCDLALGYNAMLEPDAGDPACTTRPGEPVELGSSDTSGLRIAKAGGYFEQNGQPQAFAAVDQVCRALGVTASIEVANAGLARSAAYLITMAEGASLHLDRLRSEHGAFDLDVRDRLIAGAMVPGAWVTKAQKFRRIFQAQMRALFEDVDVLIAPATPCTAPTIGQKTFLLDGLELPVRANLGLFTQPISFIGLPVVSVPVWLAGDKLPIGVQIIAAPWREDVALRVAHQLEVSGTVHAPIAGGKEAAT
jgi:1-carboxybiuret hydrolase